MLKLVGVCLILAGSSGYGIRLYLDLKEGIRHINQWIWMVEAFISEIECRKMSLPDCLREVAESMAEPYGTLLQGAYKSYEADGRGELAACFRRQIKEGTRQVPLQRQEKEIVAGLFEKMAIYDTEMQIKLLRNKKMQLEKCLVKRESELAEKKKLYTSLGVMVGLLLILILI